MVLASKIRKREPLMRSLELDVLRTLSGEEPVQRLARFILRLQVDELVVLFGSARLPFLRRTHAPDEQVDFPVQDVSDMGHEGHRICDVLRSLPLVEQTAGREMAASAPSVGRKVLPTQ